MNRDLRQTIRAFIVESYMRGASPSELDDATSFADTGIMDSTGVMELILFIENDLGFRAF
jgi:acyl carrier protein